MAEIIIAGPELRQHAITRTTGHIEWIETSNSPAVSLVTLNRKYEYLNGERRRLETLRALGGGE